MIVGVEHLNAFEDVTVSGSSAEIARRRSVRVVQRARGAAICCDGLSRLDLR
jgi:hypothetical protein